MPAAPVHIKKFEIFKHDPNDRGSIIHNEIFSLTINKRGIIWCGTKTGISASGVEAAERIEHLVNSEGVSNELATLIGQLDDLCAASIEELAQVTPA